LPRPKKKAKSSKRTAHAEQGPAVRSLWSGTITFGLVSIPVDMLAAVKPRQTAMKLIDKEGNALGRQYRCSKDGKKLANDELIRGYQNEDGEMIVITDEEFESAAPEMSPDIELKNFVAAEQIPPVYFQKPFFLAPAGKSSKAYNLLAAVMERTGRVGIGSLVMRAHEYLIAIVADNGVLRAATLRYADEIRSPETIGLPKKSKAPATLVTQFAKEIQELKRNELNTAELEDKEADELQALVKAKQKDSDKVIHQTNLESDDEESVGESAQIIDLMAALRRSLSKRAVVTTAESSEPISLDERRARKQAAAKNEPAKKTSKAKKKAKRE
jgi:DNA end-binding protein Ku